jgi:hypothetical protein
MDSFSTELWQAFHRDELILHDLDVLCYLLLLAHHSFYMPFLPSLGHVISKVLVLFRYVKGVTSVVLWARLVQLSLTFGLDHREQMVV